MRAVPIGVLALFETETHQCHAPYTTPKIKRGGPRIISADRGFLYQGF